MAEPDMEEDLFADLYDGEDADTVAPSAPAPVAAAPANVAPQAAEPPVIATPAHADVLATSSLVPSGGDGGDAGYQYEQDYHQSNDGPSQEMDFGNDHSSYNYGNESHGDSHERPIGIKEDGKMFIGGLNWETTDEKMRDYFSQFGEVVECTVMRDGATGRSRGFGFLTFKDPKVVNTVMVKEHTLDNKLIDPKRAIPRDEQERTAKIFVGGVSQEATESDFKNFFMKFGRVLDATLMMDKDTGRPRGFGFVTFDSDTAVDRTLEGPLAIHGKPIEVKRAQPRGTMREEAASSNNKFSRHGKQEPFSGFGSQEPMGQDGQNGPNNMSPAMMAQYWQRMQHYFQMMQQQMAANSMGGMNPMQAMQNNPAMMQQMMARQNMNPAMMQQMANMQNYGGNMGQANSPMNNNNGNNMRGGFNPQEQQMFEQQKYERQNMARMSQQDFNGSNTWEGMYDDVPAPAGMQGGNGRGGFNGRGGRGGNRGGAAAAGGGGGMTPQPSGQAPANAPTGPKNAGRPGANYRGGGRGGHRGFHPYARGGA